MVVLLASSGMRRSYRKILRTRNEFPGGTLPYRPYQQPQVSSQQRSAERESVISGTNTEAGSPNVHGFNRRPCSPRTKTESLLRPSSLNIPLAGWTSAVGFCTSGPRAAASTRPLRVTNYDTLDLNYALTQEFQDEIHRTGRLHTSQDQDVRLRHATALHPLPVRTCPSSGPEGPHRSQPGRR